MILCLLNNAASPRQVVQITVCYVFNLEVFKTYLMEELSETTENPLIVCFQAKF